jgi:uncharacterized protein YidB (DUF937 family)
MLAAKPPRPPEYFLQIKSVASQHGDCWSVPRIPSMALLDSVLSKITANLSGDQAQSLLKTALAQTGGLKGLAGRFNTTGLAEVFNSWVSVGENGVIRPDQIEAVLGNQTVQQIAQKLGIDTEKVSATLSQLLPQMVDQLTPDGDLEAAEVAADLAGDAAASAESALNA